MRGLRWGNAVVLVLGTAAFVFAPFPTCPVRLTFGVPCPGCGGTRAILAALRGDFATSMQLHPLAAPLLVLIVPSVLLVVRSVLLGRPSEPLPTPLRIAWHAAFAALIALWIARFFGLFGGPAPI